MDIINIQKYLDGGTVEIITTDGVFCFDNRAHSTTKGYLYDGYPKNDNSNLIVDSSELIPKIIETLKDFEDIEYQSTINELIEKYK